MYISKKEKIEKNKEKQNYININNLKETEGEKYSFSFIQAKEEQNNISNKFGQHLDLKPQNVVIDLNLIKKEEDNNEFIGGNQHIDEKGINNLKNEFNNIEVNILNYFEENESNKIEEDRPNPIKEDKLNSLGKKKIDFKKKEKSDNIEYEYGYSEENNFSDIQDNGPDFGNFCESAQFYEEVDRFYDSSLNKEE